MGGWPYELRVRLDSMRAGVCACWTRLIAGLRRDPLQMFLVAEVGEAGWEIIWVYVRSVGRRWRPHGGVARSQACGVAV